MSSVGRLLRSVSSSCRSRGYATLLVAEHDNKSLHKVSLHALAAASQLPGCTSIDFLVAGKGCGEVVKAGAAAKGVSKVLHLECDTMEHPVADTFAELLFSLQQSGKYKVIAGVSSSFLRETLPRLAVKLDVQPVTDVIAVGKEEGVFSRPMYAGNAIATVKSSDPIHILTFRPTAFEPAGEAASPAAVEIVPAGSFQGAGIQWVSNSEKSSDKPLLASANRIVAGGRALKSGENFDTVLGPLCDKLKAALGASRAAVDAGFVPNELQVG
ncbi:unnamed protein product, partial [Polarella glacialis]